MFLLGKRVFEKSYACGCMKLRKVKKSNLVCLKKSYHRIIRQVFSNTDIVHSLVSFARYK